MASVILASGQYIGSVCLWQMEKSNAVIVSSVSKMTFLRQFDWGIMPGDHAQPQQCIMFAFGPFTGVMESRVLSASINELIHYLSFKLPTTNIRVFRVPSPQRLAS